MRKIDGYLFIKEKILGCSWNWTIHRVMILLESISGQIRRELGTISDNFWSRRNQYWHFISFPFLTSLHIKICKVRFWSFHYYSRQCLYIQEVYKNMLYFFLSKVNIRKNVFESSFLLHTSLTLDVSDWVNRIVNHI